MSGTNRAAAARADGPASRGRQGRLESGESAEAAAAGAAPQHERVYQALRQRILLGGFQPGRPVTLRGIAEQLGVSPMPVREAVRRLIAERALALKDNRRVTVAAMTAAKFDEIVFARCTLEPELAARALPHIDAALLRDLAGIDEEIDRAMQAGDAEGYMRHNHAFHFALYQRSGAETLIALAESVWLQFGPFMRSVYGRFGTSQLVDQHVVALAAMAARDEPALRSAIREDIMQGMRFIGEEALKD